MVDMKTKGKLADMTALLRFLLLSGLVVTVVLVLNWIPTVVGRDAMRSYPSVEKLKHEPGFEGLLVPSYFPEGITWPPAMILGQKEPFMAAVISFDGARGRDSLVISQSTSPDFDPGGVMRFEVLRQSVEMDRAGRHLRVEIGLCHDGAQCSRVSWSGTDRHVKVFMYGPSVTLLRIVQSMID